MEQYREQANGVADFRIKDQSGKEIIIPAEDLIQEAAVHFGTRQTISF
jgi:hypothetical protein